MKLDPSAAELMERIRRGASGEAMESAPLPGYVDSLAEQSDELGAAPPFASSILKPVRAEKLNELLKRAREKTQVSRKIPKFLRRLFRKQGAYNDFMLDAAALLVSTAERLHEGSGRIADHLEAEGRWLQDLSAKLRRMETRQAAMERSVQRLAHEAGESVRQHQRLAHDFALVAHDLASAGTHLRNLQTHSETQDAQSQSLVQQNEELRESLEMLRGLAARAEDRQLAESVFVRAQLAAYGEFIRRMQRPATEGSALPASMLPEAATAWETQSLDAYYLHFENAFRGPRAEIKERLRVYLPHLAAAGVGRLESPVLDLGCGRGEWLDLLRENQLTGRGLDLSQTMVDYCAAQKLDVTHGDAVAHLRTIGDGELGAVTSFHLIEHLPFPSLMQLVQQCWRVLRPGGVLILETPNPANIQVGAHYFYRDYTHERPLPPDSTRFLVEQAGFTKTDVLPLNPCAPNELLPEENSEIARRFNAFFYGAQDYAILAVK